MNFYDYWMKLSNKEKEEIFYQKAIHIKDVEDLKKIIDRNEKNSLIAIWYQKSDILRGLEGDSAVRGSIFSNLKYRAIPLYKDGETQLITQLKYNINHFKFNHFYYPQGPFAFDYGSYSYIKNWPSSIQRGLEYYFVKIPQKVMDEKSFKFLQSQGGISFETGHSYWKIVSLFPDSKTPFLNWSDSKPWEVK